jgi:preprotein translocase subunit YajC
LSLFLSRLQILEELVASGGFAGDLLDIAAKGIEVLQGGGVRVVLLKELARENG